MWMVVRAATGKTPFKQGFKGSLKQPSQSGICRKAKLGTGTIAAQFDLAVPARCFCIQ